MVTRFMRKVSDYKQHWYFADQRKKKRLPWITDQLPLIEAESTTGEADPPGTGGAKRRRTNEEDSIDTDNPRSKRQRRASDEAEPGSALVDNADRSDKGDSGQAKTGTRKPARVRFAENPVFIGDSDMPSRQKAENCRGETRTRSCAGNGCLVGARAWEDARSMRTRRKRPLTGMPTRDVWGRVPEGGGVIERCQLSGIYMVNTYLFITNEVCY